MNLNDTKIKALSPKSKPFLVLDGDGLSLKVEPTGKKLWRFRYTYNGKEALISFGKYPEVSLAQAREKRLEARKLLAQGVNPSEHRKTVKRDLQQAAENNFQAVAEQWLKQWRIGKSERHVGYTERRLAADVYPKIGHRAIADLQALELVQVVKGIAARGAVDLALRVHQTMSMIYRYAVAHGLAPRNPAADVRPADILPSHKHKNYARVGVSELPQLMRDIENSTSTPQTRLTLKLMALTFVRTSELIGARWEEFDLGARQWRIPASRMKMDSPHIVPLAAQALAVLEALQPISGHTELLFPSRNDATKPISNNTILKALEIIGYKGKMTGHGFRGVASTILHEQGYPHDHIELQLAHSARDEVSAAYNHALYIPQRTKMMQDWADYLDAIKQGGNVVNIRGKAA